MLKAIDGYPFPGSAQPHSLLCGHHYRVSRRALAAAGALAMHLPGKADAAEAVLLEAGHHHAEAVTGR